MGEILTTARVVTLRELRSLVRSGRLLVAGVVVVLLFLLGLLGGLRQQQRVERAVRASEEAFRVDWVEQGEKNPHSAAHYGTRVARPRSPLELLIPGVTPYVGVSVRLEAHRRNPLEYLPAQDTTGLLHFGKLSPARVVEVLAPLLVILLAFPCVSQEREQGILAQVLATGAHPGGILLGKLVALAGALLLLAVLPLGAAGFLVLGGGPREVMLDLDPRCLALGIAWGLYLGTWLLVTVLLSARASRSREALLSALVLWSLVAVLAPRLGADLARSQFPPPRARVLAEQVREGVREQRRERRRALLEDLLERYQVTRREDLPVNFDALWLQAMEEHDNQVHDRAQEEIRASHQGQDRLLGAMSWLSPRLALARLEGSLAATDRPTQESFADAVELYRRYLIERLNRHMAEHSRTGDWEHTAGSDLWESVPPFRWRFPVLADQRGEILEEAAPLVAWFLGLLVLAVLVGPGEVARCSKR